MTNMKGYLFGLREKIIWISIQCQPSNATYRHKFFGNYFRWIEKIEFILVFIFFRNNLNTKIPFREIAVLNCFPQVTAVIIGIFSGNVLRFIPGDRMSAQY